MVKVLFVCMGNICRSPTAHGVFRKLVVDEGLSDQIEIDSAGTHAYHVGEAPDSRARGTAEKRGIDMGDLRARRVISADFEAFDLVLAMDRDNYQHLQAICPTGYEQRLQLFMRYAENETLDEVPDPYYGGKAGFERVLDMIEDASRGLLQYIRQECL